MVQAVMSLDEGMCVGVSKQEQYLTKARQRLRSDRTTYERRFFLAESNKDGPTCLLH